MLYGYTSISNFKTLNIKLIMNNKGFEIISRVVILF